MKIKRFVFFGLLFCLFFALSGCGTDTRNWPRLSLPFDKTQLTKATISYHKQPYGRDSETIEDRIEISDNSILENIYEMSISFPYKKEEKNDIDTDNYWTKVEVVMSYNDEGVENEYTLIYYGYGVSNGYLVFDNKKIHFCPSDFVSFMYMSIKEELTNA